MSAALKPTPDAPLIRLRDLHVKFESRDRTVHAVNGVDLDLAAGEVLCILGESGSGKSVTLRALMKLLPKTAKVTGEIKVGGRDVQAMIQADLAFHRDIYQASGNPLIAQSIDLHWHHLKRVMGAVLQSSHQRQTVWAEHEAIANAIAAGDADVAVRLVQEHAHKASVQLTARLSEQIQHLKTGAQA